MDVDRLHAVTEEDENEDNVFETSFEEAVPAIQEEEQQDLDFLSDEAIDTPVDEAIDEEERAYGDSDDSLSDAQLSLDFQDDWMDDDDDDDDDDDWLIGQDESTKQETSMGTVGLQERVAMLRLRRELNEVNKLVSDCRLEVEETTRELAKCREVIDDLKAERTSVEAEIKRLEGEKNIAAAMRLKGQLARIGQQIETEESIEHQIRKTLDKAELSLNRVELEQHRYHVTGQQLAGKERLFEMQNEMAVERRLMKEMKTAAGAKVARQAEKREQMEAIKIAKQKHMDIMADAKRSQAKAAKFLDETLSRVRQHEAEQQAYSHHMFKERMQTFIRLKQNIQENRDSMKALQMIRNKQQAMADHEEAVERQVAKEAGLNPDEVIMKRRHMQKFVKEKELFDREQQKNKVEIVQKLLVEERQAKRKERKACQPQWQDKWEHKKLSRQPVSTGVNDRLQRDDDHVDGLPAAHERTEEDVLSGQRYKDTTSRQEDGPVLLPSSTDDEPDGRPIRLHNKLDIPKGVQGLWQTTDPLTSSMGELKVKEQSKLEKEMMQKAKQKLKESAVITQIAAGREFKGRPFNSKPEVVVFEDFDMGKTYRKKVVLTNVSYTVNYCKLQGISDSLGNCIEIGFNPPGPMSAGMACEMTVTFTPEMNVDVDGEISFLAQTGPFSVPVQCITKKCKVSVSSNCVEFRPACVGETRRRTIKLINDGALGTSYKIRTISDGLISESRSEVVESVQVAESLQIIASDAELVKSSSIPSENGQQLQSGSVQSGFVQASSSDVSLRGKTIEHTSSSLLDPVMEGEEEAEEEAAKEMTKEDRQYERKKSDVTSTDPSETKLANVTSSVTDVVVVSESQRQSQVTLEPVPSSQLLVTDGKRDDEEVSGVEKPSEVSPLRLGKNSSGYLDPHSMIDIEIIFFPTAAGDYEQNYAIVFAEQETDEVTLTATGTAIDLPIYVERQVIDLKVCMLNRLYQDSVIVHNRSATALRVTFDVPLNIREHMEILPKHGLVQGESSFSAQLKFLPRHSVLDECVDRLNDNTGHLAVRVSIHVVDQTRPVPFTVQSTVTSTDLQFNPNSFEFGMCTIYESVVSTVQLTNTSVLPQTFGFVQLPKGMDVQPNDGFGTLLPEETITLDLIFSPEKPKEYNFTLTCKSGIGREFLIDCSAVATLPALRLSQNIIEFCPTAVEDSRSTHVYVENPLHGRLSEEAIRGQAPPSLPMAFEFAVPREYPLFVSPTVGIVKPGQRQQVSITFAPRLDPAVVLAEAWKIAKQKATQAAHAARAAADMASAKEAEESGLPQTQVSPKKKKQGGRRSASSSLKLVPSISSTSVASRKIPELDDVPEPAEGSDDYWEAYSTLLRGFQSSCIRVYIPCFVAGMKKSGQPEHRPHDTLYLEISLPTIRPSLLVSSDNGRCAIDFGPACKGHLKLQTVSLQNISDETLTLRSSVLDSEGTFEMRNALRPILPGRVHNMVVGFCPVFAEKFCEVFKVFYGDSALALRLYGEGITPEVSLSLNQNEIDLGDRLCGDSHSIAFKIANTSPISVQYCIRLDSSLVGLKSARRLGTDWLVPSVSQSTGMGSSQFETGVRCNDGSCAFDVSPFEGAIKAGEAKEVTVRFTPDHPSQMYFDAARIELSTQDEAQVIRLVGRCWANSVYVVGWDDFSTSREFLGVDFNNTGSGSDTEGKLPTVTVSLTFMSVGGQPSTRELEVGCIKSALVKKSSGDFTFDPLSAPLAKTFQIDNIKGSVDSGSRKVVGLTFCPPTEHNHPSDVITAKTVLTLRGEKTQQFEVLLRGVVKSSLPHC